MAASDDTRLAALHATWHDIQPVLDTPANANVVAIRYTPYHEALLQYLRTVVDMPERSQRVLDLTTEVIEVNPACYTAWQLRWECLEALGSNLEDELGSNADVVADNPKNYQDWNHRRRCFDVLGTAFGKQELVFCALVLAEDAKNYHVWSHRQHVVRACSLWQHELAFTATAIAADVRNNSAWNQRMFCLLGEAQGGPLPVAVVDRELAFARVYTLCAPNNEAAWAYVGGLAAHAAVVDGAPGRVASLATDGRYHALVEEALALDPHCVFAHALLAEVYGAQASVLGAAGDATRAAEARMHAAAVLQRLQVLDPLRSNWWASQV